MIPSRPIRSKDRDGGSGTVEIFPTTTLPLLNEKLILPPEESNRKILDRLITLVPGSKELK
jgi:hypothetical protein